MRRVVPSFVSLLFGAAIGYSLCAFQSAFHQAQGYEEMHRIYQSIYAEYSKSGKLSAAMEKWDKAAPARSGLDITVKSIFIDKSSSSAVVVYRKRDGYQTLLLFEDQGTLNWAPGRL